MIHKQSGIRQAKKNIFSSTKTGLYVVHYKEVLCLLCDNLHNCSLHSNLKLHANMMNSASHILDKAGGILLHATPPLVHEPAYVIYDIFYWNI